MKSKKIELVCLFGNGNIAVCSKGQQIPKLQGNVIVQLIKKARRLGYKIDENTEILLPNGLKAKKLKEFDNISVLKQ